MRKSCLGEGTSSTRDTPCVSGTKVRTGRRVLRESRGSSEVRRGRVRQRRLTSEVDRCEKPRQGRAVGLVSTSFLLESRPGSKRCPLVHPPTDGQGHTGLRWGGRKDRRGRYFFYDDRGPATRGPAVRDLGMGWGRDAPVRLSWCDIRRLQEDLGLTSPVEGYGRLGPDVVTESQGAGDHWSVPTSLGPMPSRVPTGRRPEVWGDVSTLTPPRRSYEVKWVRGTS